MGDDKPTEGTFIVPPFMVKVPSVKKKRLLIFNVPAVKTTFEAADPYK